MINASELPAGRELDALVAVKVMNWQHHDTYWGPRSKGGLINCRRCEASYYSPPWTTEKVGQEWCGQRPYQGPPAYSIDIAAAWQAVDALSARGLSLVLEDWRNDTSAPAKWAALFTLPDGHDTGQLCADTAPLAICRAAIRAVEHTTVGKDTPS